MGFELGAPQDVPIGVGFVAQQLVKKEFQIYDSLL